MRRVLRTLAPRVVAVEDEPLPALEKHEVLVRTLRSAISAGTEMLVYRGEMPADVAADASFEHLQEAFRYPAAYGYCAVGRVERRGDAASSFSVGDAVFAFREHCNFFVAREADLIAVPPGTEVDDAVLLPAVETAVSVAHDAALLPGEAAVVVGQGAIGLLVAACLRGLHPYSVVRAVEPREARRRLSAVHEALTPAEALADVSRHAADVAIDTSGAGAGLDTAIRLTRASGRLVLASWFGAKKVALAALGGAFHRSHCTIVASQVSDIPVQLRGRWSKERRFDLAWRLLADIRPARMLACTKIPFEEAPRAFKEVDEGAHVQVVFTYCAEDEGS